MTSLARYHGRSPRYILSTEDYCLIRVAGPKQIPWEEGTEIKNVSLTGLSFTAPDDLCPLLGEFIKIQFKPPGSTQMACYGIVTRLENISQARTLVGVHFYKMELPQRVGLAQGLSKKLKEAHNLGQQDNLLNPDRPTISLLNLPQLFILSWLGILWAGTMWSLFHWNYWGLCQLALRWLNQLGIDQIL